MDYYIIDKVWDETLNSPWDAIWDEGLPHNALGCLYGSMPLAAVWRSPPVRLERRTKRPDVYGFVLHYAVTEAARDLFSNIAKQEAEFLPVEVPNLGLLYVIHPLWPIDFDDRAKYSCNSVSKNITDVLLLNLVGRQFKPSFLFNVAITSSRVLPL